LVAAALLEASNHCESVLEAPIDPHRETRQVLFGLHFAGTFIEDYNIDRAPFFERSGPRRQFTATSSRNAWRYRRNTFSIASANSPARCPRWLRRSNYRRITSIWSFTMPSTNPAPTCEPTPSTWRDGMGCRLPDLKKAREARRVEDLEPLSANTKIVVYNL
jgi:hypothetical protein